MENKKLKILSSVKIILSITLLFTLSGISYFYYKTQVYIPRIKSECNESALHQAVDSYEIPEISPFLNVLAKTMRKNGPAFHRLTPEEQTQKINQYYEESINKNLYEKNQYELNYKQCLRSKGL